MKPISNLCPTESSTSRPSPQRATLKHRAAAEVSSSFILEDPQPHGMCPKHEFTWPLENHIEIHNGGNEGTYEDRNTKAAIFVVTTKLGLPSFEIVCWHTLKIGRFIFLKEKLCHGDPNLNPDTSKTIYVLLDQMHHFYLKIHLLLSDCE